MRPKTHFAVQMRGNWETVDDIAELVLQAASDVKLTFDTLEVLDTFTVGTSRFARCRIDLLNPFPLLDVLFAAGRGVVVPSEVYQVRLPGGRTGSIPHATMQAVPRAPRMFRGTSNPHWKRQFPQKSA